MVSASSFGSIPAEAAPVQARGSFGLADFLRIVEARRDLIQRTTLAVIALTVLVLLVLPTLYSTSAIVILDQRKNNVAELSAVLSELPTDPASLQNQIQILTSRDLALQVIAKLKLYDDPEFNTALRPGLLDVFLRAANPRNWDLAGQPMGQERALLQRDAIVSAFLRRLSVDAVGLSTTIEVTFSARDPQKAALIANTIADTYVEDQLAIKREAALKTNQWLLDRIHRLAQQVQAEEAAAQTFKAENNLTEMGDGSSLVAQQIAAISNQLVQARADVAVKQATYDRVNTLVRAGNTADVSQILASPLIIQLRTQQADLLRQEGELATRYGARHPKLIAVQTQRKDLQEKIAQEVDRLAGSIANDVAVARAQAGSLQASLAQVEKQASSQNMTRVRLKALEANVQSTRAIYEAFVARLRETQDQSDIQTPDARVISRAPIPVSPSSPRRMLIFAASIPAGLLLGLLVALLAERLAGPVPPRTLARRPAVMQSAQNARPAPTQAPAVFSGPPVLAEIFGAFEEHAVDHVIDWPQSAFAQTIGALLHRIMVQGRTSGAKVIAIAAPEWGDAKTPIALGLARGAARAGLKVAIVDGDLYRPCVAGMAGAGPVRAGIVEVLGGAVPLSRAFVKDSRSSVLILSCVQRPPNPAAVLGSPKMAELVAHLRRVCDLVILDSTPLQGSNDVQFLARLSDAVLVIARSGALQQPQAMRAVGALAGARLAPTGVVLTR